MKDDSKSNLRLVGGPADTDLDTTKARSMGEVLAEARAREATAVRNARLSDAALYREIGDRALAVMHAERKLKPPPPPLRLLPEQLRVWQGSDQDDLPAMTPKRDDSAASKVQRGLIWFCIAVVLASASFFLTGCSSNMPRIQAPAGTVLEVSAGQSVVSARGSDDLGDVGPYSVVELGFAGGEHAYKGEFWMQGGSIDAADVDAGALGLFDLEADVYRFGVGMRTTPRRHLGLDWSLGLGACITVASGEARVGALTADVDESGLGAYASGDVSRGPLFLRLRYIDGPTADVDDVDVELGGLSVTGGLRWSF